MKQQGNVEMLKNASETLLPEVMAKNYEAGEHLDSGDEATVNCDHGEVSYGIGDALFTSFVVAPQVVSVWRGTWVLMDLNSNMFPYAQSFLLGIVIHICFALTRSYLLSRSTGAWRNTGSAGRWLRERALSRVYHYIFTLSNIMHWRGGWGLLDAFVRIVLHKEDDPHKPVLIAALTTLCYFCAVGLRSSRNILASPYFLVTDGKEPTYIFTTRFKKTCAVDMRGSSAGLADTLAGDGPRGAVLAVADAALAGVLLAPAVVTYWKSTWTLLDLYVLPTRPVASAAACAAFGLCCHLLLCVFQTHLGKRLSPDRGRLTFYIVSRLYTCVAGVACVAAWRGVWNLLNECTGDSARTLLSTTAAATLSLAALRGLRNICAAPFAVVVDTPQDYFDVPTMFRTNSRETILYVLDCIFSVAVVGSLVVFVWRGSWALLDIFLFPDDQVKSCWTSLIIGYALVVVTFALQAPVRWAAARLHGAPRLLLADVYHLISFIATVNVWRGVWGLLDVYFFPDTPKLSNWCSHIISLSLLILLNCSNSILVRGVYIDAEEPAGECVVFPCHYLRLFFHKERTKKRHRKALQTAASKKVEDASLPLQMPEEKV